MKEAGVAGLIERFSNLPDPRVEGRTDHDLLDIIVLALCAVMSGAEGWDDIEDWGRERETWLRQYLPLRNGIPGHDTIRRVFEAISPHELEQRFEAWMGEVCEAVKGRVIAIDGKALRGSARTGRGLRALHQVSAYAAEYGLTLGQRPCQEKSNEITAIETLLPSLALAGAVVTIDAIGCQTEIAQKILDRGGDYLLAVKDNQETLANALREFFADGERAGFGTLPISRAQTVEKGHGRIETRQALWVTDLSWLDKKLRQHWPKLAGIGMIERQREINGAVSVARAFYIGSKGVTTAESFAKAARSHWGIENSLHWVLDVTFREDDCRVRKDHAPHNFSALRKFALALLRQDTQYPKRSLRSRRKTAERLPDYRASLLGLKLRG